MEYPDLPFLRWSYEYGYSSEFREDYRSTGIIENSERYIRAFCHLKLVPVLSNCHVVQREILCKFSISWGNSFGFLPPRE